MTLIGLGGRKDMYNSIKKESLAQIIKINNKLKKIIKSLYEQ
jgi:hypothetical protein